MVTPVPSASLSSCITRCLVVTISTSDAALHVQVRPSSPERASLVYGLLHRLPCHLWLSLNAGPAYVASQPYRTSARKLGCTPAERVQVWATLQVCRPGVGLRSTLGIEPCTRRASVRISP